jgi:hypothetical protein
MENSTMSKDVSSGWVFLLGAIVGAVVTSGAFYFLRYEPPMFELASDLDLTATYALPGKSPFAKATLDKGSLMRVHFQIGRVAYVQMQTAIERDVLEKHARLVREGSGSMLFGTVGW